MPCNELVTVKCLPASFVLINFTLCDKLSLLVCTLPPFFTTAERHGLPAVSLEHKLIVALHE